MNVTALFIGTDLYNPQIIYTLGALDDIRIGRRALTEAEIQTLYTAQ